MIDTLRRSPPPSLRGWFPRLCATFFLKKRSLIPVALFIGVVPAPLRYFFPEKTVVDPRRPLYWSGSRASALCFPEKPVAQKRGNHQGKPGGGGWGTNGN